MARTMRDKILFLRFIYFLAHIKSQDDFVDENGRKVKLTSMLIVDLWSVRGLSASCYVNISAGQMGYIKPVSAQIGYSIRHVNDL